MPTKADILAHLSPADREKLERSVRECLALESQMHRLAELAREERTPKTHQEIADRLGCSRSNVWLIERNVLRKLRRRTPEELNPNN